MNNIHLFSTYCEMHLIPSGSWDGVSIHQWISMFKRLLARELLPGLYSNQGGLHHRLWNTFYHLRIFGWCVYDYCYMRAIIQDNILGHAQWIPPVESQPNHQYHIPSRHHSLTSSNPSHHILWPGIPSPPSFHPLPHISSMFRAVLCHSGPPQLLIYLK